MVRLITGGQYEWYTISQTILYTYIDTYTRTCRLNFLITLPFLEKLHFFLIIRNIKKKIV